MSLAGALSVASWAPYPRVFPGLLVLGYFLGSLSSGISWAPCPRVFPGLLVLGYFLGSLSSGISIKRNKLSLNNSYCCCADNTNYSNCCSPVLYVHYG